MKWLGRDRSPLRPIAELRYATAPQHTREASGDLSWEDRFTLEDGTKIARQVVVKRVKHSLGPDDTLPTDAAAARDAGGAETRGVREIATLLRDLALVFVVPEEKISAVKPGL